MNHHLTEDEFSDLLIEGASKLCVLAHLNLCEQCRNEVAVWQGATTAFNELGGRWAQREIADLAAMTTLWAVRPRIKSRLAFAFGITTTAVAMLLALASSSAFHLAHTSALRSAAPSAAEIAHDNQWLTSMDEELQAGPDNIVIAPSEAQALQQHIPSRHRDRR